MWPLDKLRAIRRMVGAHGIRLGQKRGARGAAFLAVNEVDCGGWVYAQEGDRDWSVFLFSGGRSLADFSQQVGRLVLGLVVGSHDDFGLYSEQDAHAACQEEHDRQRR
jgi:hypothetical protein